MRIAAPQRLRTRIPLDWVVVIRWSCYRFTGVSYFSGGVQDEHWTPWRWRARRRYTDTMLNREACERRVYRLATRLTGNPVAATRVIESVVDAQPDLRRLDNTHMDRLTVLRSRELAPGRLVVGIVPPAAAEALALLTSQQREAWVFTHVYRVKLRDAARAMDCSVTATSRHLQVADDTVAERLGAAVEQAIEALLSYSMALDVPAFYRAARRRCRQRRLLIMVGAAGAAVLAIIAGLFWLGGLISSL